MKTSFATLVIPLVATVSAVKLSVSDDGFLHLNGKQLVASDGVIDFQASGSDFTVGKDGTLSLSNGQQVNINRNGDAIYGSGAGAKDFGIKDGKMTWARGDIYACLTEENYQKIRRKRTGRPYWRQHQFGYVI
ncbi:hypothetical protein HZ326_25096 [Fusarium oxysporum f. sp. albedinis]|nr:hypothetical protein HZ326_25096 [Fusarium oxysporum f. sp. albedinis]